MLDDGMSYWYKEDRSRSAGFSQENPSNAVASLFNNKVD